MEEVWDPLRKKMVALTPEEKVRQWFIGVLHSECGMPLHMMASEVSLQYGSELRKKAFRADIVVWDRNLRPGLFKSDQNAALPKPQQYIEDELSQLDIDLRLAKDYEEIDRMNAENEALYNQSLMPPITSTRIPFSQSHTIAL